MESWRGRWSLIALEGLLIGVAYLLGWLFGQPPLSHCFWSSAGWTWGLLGTLPMLAGLGVCLAWPEGPWRSLVQLVDSTLVPLFRTWKWSELALAAALAGLGEEMLFRGMIQDALVERIGAGPIAAILVTGTLFGLAHAVTWSYALFASLVGLYLGWLYVAAGDLAAPIVAHGVYDFFALAYLARIRQPPNENLVESPDVRSTLEDGTGVV